MHVHVCVLYELWDGGWMMVSAFWDDILDKSMAKEDDRGMAINTARNEAQKPMCFFFSCHHPMLSSKAMHDCPGILDGHPRNVHHPSTRNKPR